MTEALKNHTFASLRIGDEASLTRTVGVNDISMVAALSGDVSPSSLEPVFAGASRGHSAAHGSWTAAMVAAVLGTRLPGPGTVRRRMIWNRRPDVGLEGSGSVG